MTVTPGTFRETWRKASNPSPDTGGGRDEIAVRDRLGVEPKYGAAALIAFGPAVSPSMHNFWADEDESQRMHDAVDFAKNLALAGGALAMTGVEEPHTGARSAAKRVKTARRVLAA